MTSRSLLPALLSLTACCARPRVPPTGGAGLFQALAARLDPDAPALRCGGRVAVLRMGVDGLVPEPPAGVETYIVLPEKAATVEEWVAAVAPLRAKVQAPDVPREPGR